MLEIINRKTELKPRKKTMRQERAEETKRKLMETAISLFASQGYENVSIEDITNRAGVSKGTFYCHYTSKTNLVLESMNVFEAANHEFYSQAMKESNPVDQLMAYMRCVMDYTVKVLTLDLIKVVFTSYINNGNMERPFSKRSRPVYLFMEQIILKGQHEGVFRNDVPAMEMAAIMVQLMRSCVFEWCIDNGTHDLTEMAQRRFNMAVQILYTNRYWQAS